MRFGCQKPHTKRGKCLPNDHITFDWLDGASRRGIFPVGAKLNFPGSVNDGALHKPVMQKGQFPQPKVEGDYRIETDREDRREVVQQGRLYRLMVEVKNNGPGKDGGVDDRLDVALRCHHSKPA